MAETDNFPKPGETRAYYCTDCKTVVDWEVIEKEGEYYWYTASCGKTVKIGKWPEGDIQTEA